jgi:glycerol-3-phosphate dehydrogenase
MNRTHALHRLPSETFDLCIIGGGASGAGCALDASLRGLRVALIEQTDFASETSSKSTKLIHGGVRYLEEAFKNLDFGQLRQVRHGLEERHILLHIAPHLAHPLALLTPVWSWVEGMYYTIGLKLYDHFASRKDNLPKSRWLKKNEALERMPGLTSRIHSAVLYYDGQLDDARFCLALVQSAAEAGAAVANHLQATGFEKDSGGKLKEVRVTDRLSGAEFSIHARCFLNCTGPHADQVRMMANPEAGARIRPSKGVHVMLPASVLPGGDALLIPKTPDGRVVFAIPFEGDVLLGTTDHEYPDPDKEPVLESEEVDFLLQTLQPYVDRPLDKKTVKAGFGGLRPLLAPSRKKNTSPTKQLLRDHEVEYDAPSGLFSLLGGKWTTYRLMARDATDAVCRMLGNRSDCHTDEHLLYGADGYRFKSWETLGQAFGLDEAIARHLVQKYGSHARTIAEMGKSHPEWSRRLHPDYPFLEAEVVYAAREEMACTVADVLARRMRLEITDWKAASGAAPRVAQLLAAALEWPETRRISEEKLYQERIQTLQKRAFGLQ